MQYTLPLTLQEQAELLLMRKLHQCASTIGEQQEIEKLIHEFINELFRAIEAEWTHDEEVQLFRTLDQNES